MQLHAKKKVEVILEAPLLRRTLEVIAASGASGYTVLPAHAGTGSEGPWKRGQVSDAFQMACIVVICDAAIAEKLVDEVFGLLRHYTAIVYVSDVGVVRSEKY